MPLGNQLLGRGVLAAHHDASPHRIPLGEAVNPCHRIGPTAGSFEAVHDFIEIGRPDGFLENVGGLDLPQPESGGKDDPAQPHAAHRHLEEFSILRRRAGNHRAVVAHYIHRKDVLAEGAIDMVILSVHIGGDGTAHRDQLSPRRDRQEPAPRHEDVQNFRQQHPRLAAKFARFIVERQEFIEAAGQQDPVLQRGIAIRASIAESNHLARHLQRPPQLLPGIKTADLGVDDRIVPPVGYLAHAHLVLCLVLDWQ